MAPERALKRATDGAHHLLFDPDLGTATVRWFDPEYWQSEGRVRATDGGRGSAWFVDHGDARWVLRHYRRGGRAAAISKDRYVYTGLAHTRAFRECQLLYQMQALSLPAPAPVAACVTRHGLTYSARLLTVAIPQTRTLANCLGEQQLDSDLLAAVGRCVRSFHAHGICHADLNAHNVLVDHAQQVYLIDFDRGEQRAGSAWQQGNVDRFARSLNKLSRQEKNDSFDANLWSAFVAGYEAGR